MKTLWMALALVLSIPFTAHAVSPLMPSNATPSNFTVPAGWQLERTQNFEVGLGSHEFIFPNGSLCTPPLGAHGGTKASCGGLSKGWGIEPAPFVEHYIIYWQYIDAAVKFNDEMLEWHMLHQGPFQEHLLDWYNNKRVDAAQGWGEYNSLYAFFKPVSNGPRDHQFNSLLGDSIVPVGQWFQMQVYFKPNTPGLNDGIIRAWQNGVPLADVTDNLVGSQNMSNSRLSLGGSYTKLLWWTTASLNVCSDTMSKGFNPSVITDPVHARCFDPPCLCPPDFVAGQRYFDDIIILVPTAGPVIPDTTPPSVPTGLTITPNGAGQVTVTWTASTDNVGVTGYEVQRCTGASCTPSSLLTTVAGTSYVSTGLSSSTVYGFRIRALDAAANASAYTAVSYGTTTATFRSILATDTFIRADNTDLGTQWDASYSGSGLGTGAVNLKILSNRVTGTSLTGDALETFNGVTGAGTVTFDAVGGSCAGCTAAPTSPVSLTHVSGGNALYLGCAVGVRGSGSSHPPNNQDSDFVIGTPTYNGVSMTQVGSNIHSGSGHTGYLALYRLLGPAAGSHTVSIPFTNANPDVRDAIECGTVSFSGVDQSTPENNFTSAAGSSASASVTVTSAVGNMVLDILAAGSNYVSSNQTIQWSKNNNTNTAGGNGAGSTAAGASTVTMGYTVVNDGWSIAGVNVRASTGALPNDQWAAYPIQNYVPATASFGIPCRMADSPTVTGYMGMIRAPGTTAAIEKWTAGTKADLQTASIGVSQVGDELSFECEGTALRLYRKRGSVTTLLTSTTDATVAGGKTGIRLAPTAAVADIQVGQFTTGTFTATAQNPVAPVIASSTVDPTGGNLTFSGTTPTTIRVQVFHGSNPTTNTIEPIASFPGGRYTFTWIAGSTSVCWYAIDAAGVENSANSLYYKCNSLLNVAPNPDINSPNLTNLQPSATLPAGTTSTIMSVSLNEPAICYYGTLDGAFGTLPNAMTVVGLTASVTISGLTDGMTPVTYYIRCQDLSFNVNTSSAAITVAVAVSTADTTLPSTVAGLTATAVSATQVNLMWTAPTDNVAVAGTQLYVALGVGNTTYNSIGPLNAGTSASLNGLPANTVFNFVAKAQDTSGNLSASNSAVATAITPPAPDVLPPTLMTNLHQIACGRFACVLGWDTGVDDSGTVLTTIEQCTGVNCTNFVPIVNKAAITSYVVNLTANTFYRWRGIFSDPTGNVSTSYSNIAEATTNSTGLGSPRATLPAGVSRGTVTPSSLSSTRPPRP